MKKIMLCVAVMIAGMVFGMAEPAYEVDNFNLHGEIAGENITFNLSFDADVHDKDTDMLLIAGDVGLLAGDLDARGYEIAREGNRLFLDFRKNGSMPVEIAFASRAAQKGDWRETTFIIPESTVRKIEITCDRPDLEIDFPNALKVARKLNAEGQAEITAYLGVSDTFQVRWKPEVRKLSAETVVSCEANTIASASVGVLRQESVFTYNLAQGTLENLAFELPSEISVTQVKGDDILSWIIKEGDGGSRLLSVHLNRPQEKNYRLRVDSELVLPEFPCQFELPMPRPLNVIRTSGFLLIGTESAIKLMVDKAAGLTQIDLDGFPAQRMPQSAERLQSINKVFAYQYANMPFDLTIDTDDIITTYSSEDRIVIDKQDDDLTLTASVELDVRDAPAREITIETDPEWIVANVEGGNVGDYSVRDEDGRRLVTVLFRQATIGKTLFDVRLERTLPQDAQSFSTPRFVVRGAESERGFLVLSAEKGVRFEAEGIENLREIHTKSVPMKVAETRLAYRFKTAGWSLSVNIQETAPSVYCEIFHLVSLGENALYGSSSLTYHVGEAPVREFKLKVPDEYQHVEFTGRDIRSRKQEDGIWKITLQEKILGDYTLLVTYDQQFDYQGGKIVLGGVATENITGETGFIALAGRASLSVKDSLSIDPAIISIEQAEIPQEYKLLVNDPILRAYKYVGSPHAVALELQRYETQTLLGQVADHTTLETRISAEGEAVTEATYFVKNTSSQYLTIVLPVNARLWSVSVDGKQVQALDTAGEDSGVLVPLERNVDPNHPLKVMVEYAESHAPLNWRSSMHFRAPICKAQSVFSTWRLTVPEKFSVAESGGNMMNSDPAASTGILALFGRMAGTAAQLWYWLPPFLVLAVFAWIIAFQRGRGTKAVVPSILFVLCLIPALFIALGLAFGNGIIPATWGDGFLTAGAPRTVDLTKVVSLAGSGLESDLRIVAAWLGADGSILGLVLGVAAGLALLATGHFKSRNRLLLAGAGLTVLTWGLSQTVASLAIASAALTLLLPLALTIVAAMAFYRTGRLHPKPPRARRPAKRPSPRPGGVQTQEQSVRAESGHSAAPATTTLLAILMLATAGTQSAAAREQNRSQAIQAGQAVMQQTQTASRATAPEPAAPTRAFVRDFTVAITAPSVEKDGEKVAELAITCSVETDEPRTFKLLSADTVLLDYRIDRGGWSFFGRDDASIISRDNGSFLVIRESGEYKIRISALVPVREAMGEWSLGLYLPPNLKNQATLNIPDKGFNVVSEQAVLLQTRPEGSGSTTKAVFGVATDIAITWKPQVRKAELEEVAFFANSRTEVLCDSGVVNLDNRIHYQIAQGEIQSLAIDIPAGMSVTAVDADGLSTWRFDPATQRLEAMLEKPVSDNFVLRIVTQIAREGLPYDVDVGLPRIAGAEYQRGAIAVAVPANVQALIKQSTGLYSMNIADFQRTNAAKGQQRKTSLKRAFRYHQLPATVTIRADEVLPEIRVEETASADISDERIVLSTKLGLNIAKAGVFSVKLEIPEGYEVESLTGANISHWDEVGENAGRLAVHFKKQMLGQQQINLVLTRIEKNLGDRVDLPRVRVEGALKHKGVLTVSGERGVRLTTLERQGVSELNPRELGIQMPGYLAFRVLRPDWSVTLKTEILDPIVKTDLLQKIELDEGVLSGQCYIKYEIDNAGCKQFFLQAPRPDVALSILGKDIADVEQIDKENGIWRIDLHNKVEREYSLEASYQISFDPKRGETRIEPLITKNVAARQGYLVVMADGRLQIKHGVVPNGLRDENARGIPADFGAGDLSDAILCYRVATEDYELDISVIRHDSASVLPAAVKSVGMDSVVSADDQIVTRMRIEMATGDMRLLKIWLPEGNKVWSVYVNGNSTKPLLKDDAHLIPLASSEEGQDTVLELIYGGRLTGLVGNGKYAVQGPRLNLPLNNIEWSVYMPPNVRYHDFDGTMKYDQDAASVVAEYSAQLYTSTVQQEARRNMQKAEEVLSEGEKYAQAGQQRQAKLAFQSAMNYSKGDANFNADARIQYRNIAKKQAVVGLVNRRSRLKRSINVADEQPVQQMEGFNDGNWSPEYESRIEQSLSVKDNKSLNIVAERIIGQQAAAVAEAPSIRLTLPVSGKRLDFEREIQINPRADMEISFKAALGGWTRRLHVAMVLAGIFCIYMAIIAVAPTRT